MPVSTPIKIEKLRLWAVGYDNVYRSSKEIFLALQWGARIGVFGSPPVCVAARNHPSALEHPCEVDSNIASEIAMGRIALISPEVAKSESVCISPIAAIQKKGSEKFRTINDLSFPCGASVNDALTRRPKCAYESVDDAMAMLIHLGRGVHMAKIDIKDAFRLIPVHPHDRRFLGLVWQGQIYIDLRLPFGLRNSPPWFEALADLLAWIIRVKLGMRDFIRYVDDFLVFAPTTSLCALRVAAIVQLFAEVGVPVNMDKLKSEGSPAQVCTFLGIELDSNLMQARLPPAKVDLLLAAIRFWRAQCRWTRKQLQSLLGLLAFATKVVVMGRAFKQRLLAALRAQPSGTFNSYISIQCKEDLQWWECFLRQWNGTSLLTAPIDPAWSIFSDACETGWGVYCRGFWIAQAWSDQELALARRTSRVSMPFLELFALTAGVLSFANVLRGRRVLIYCDCLPVVAAISSCASSDPGMMALIRELCLVCANQSIACVPSHIPGIHNTAADLLSRNQMSAFRLRCPSASRSPMSPIRPSLRF